MLNGYEAQAQITANIQEHMDNSPDLQDCITSLKKIVPLYVCKGGVLLYQDQDTKYWHRVNNNGMEDIDTTKATVQASFGGS